mgnify:CR=1 FL=1
MVVTNFLLVTNFPINKKGVIGGFGHGDEFVKLDYCIMKWGLTIKSANIAYFDENLPGCSGQNCNFLRLIHLWDLEFSQIEMNKLLTKQNHVRFE